jgi:type I thyroxine 5'-deiodinase
VQVFCVYIQEAHPTDGWQVLMNIDQAIEFAQPQNADERANVAEACVLKLDLQMPMLLDDMSNAVDTQYCALPERLFVLDAKGVITYRSEMGPWGFDVDAFTEAIQKVIGA